MPENSDPDSELQTWKVILAYDGTDFQGWQVQPGLRTIQGELQAALGRVCSETPLPQASGRTDAGVHALAQVASFTLRAPIPPDNLLRALNRTLPPSIRISEARTVRSTFHARHSAIAKTYEYRIFRAEICPPFLARFVYTCPWPFNLSALEAAGKLFEGEHDFTSFTASDPDLAERGTREQESGGARERESEATGNRQQRTETSAAALEESTVRKIFSSQWERRENEAGKLLVYRVRGNGFLHHMVRNLVGTMLDVGRGQLAPDDIARILAKRNRSAAGPTAPARGLFLHSVEYPPEASSSGA